jgi:ABC-2 type transport system permease protein
VTTVTILSAARHELRMQIRRPALWIAFGVVTAIAAVMMATAPWSQPLATPLPHVMAEWSVGLNLFHPVLFGCLLADRLIRSRRIGVAELAAATPSTPGAWLASVYVGTVTATLIPIVVFWAAAVAVAAVRWGDLRAIPLGVAAFVTINLPGLLLVAAASLVFPLLLPVPLYQFLFIGGYMWANWVGPSWGIPTMSGTWLTPAGGFAASGLFGGELIHGGRATASEAVASIALLLAVAAGLLIAARWWLARPDGSWQAGGAMSARA